MTGVPVPRANDAIKFLTNRRVVMQQLGREVQNRRIRGGTDPAVCGVTAVPITLEQPHEIRVIRLVQRVEHALCDPRESAPVILGRLVESLEVLLRARSSFTAERLVERDRSEALGLEQVVDVPKDPAMPAAELLA